MKSIYILLFYVASSWASIYYPGYSEQPPEPVKYVLTHSTFIQSGFKFNLILFENENYTLPATFDAELTTGYGSSKQKLASQTFTQNSYGLQQHSFNNIAQAASSMSDSGLQVTVNFKSSGLNYTDLNSYTNSLKDKFAFLQTDKAMYKPGQKVQFRAVFLDRELKPLSGKVDVVIEDPKKNQIKQWRDQTLDRGIFGAFIQLSDYVNFGDWRIVYSGDFFSGNEVKTFTVEQYVLPKYEVTTDWGSDSYWIFDENSESKYEGFIRAKYTFGKSVKGTANVRLENTGGCNYEYDRPEWGYYGSNQPRPAVKKLEYSVTLTGDGSASDGSFVMTGLNDLIKEANNRNRNPEETTYTGMRNSMCSIQIEVNVTEELTGEIIKSEGSVMLYRDPYAIKTHDSIEKTFKFGIPYTMRMQVTTPDDSPVEAGKEVDIEAFFWKEDDPDRYSVYCWSPYSYNRGKKPRAADLTEKKTTDSNGIVEIVVTPPKNISSIQFRATLAGYPTVQLCDTRQAPQTSSKQALSIAIDRPVSATASIPSVGDKIRFNIKTTYAAKYVYFLLSQNGETFKYQRLTDPATNSDSTTFTIEVELPQAAAPRCAAAAWTVENTAHEVLADAIEFKVDGLVRQEVSASFSPQTVRPGAKTSLTVKTSEPNAVVALLAVDKSVKLLKSGNDISLDDVVSSIGGGGSFGVTPILFRCWRCGWFPWWVDSSNAESVFNGISMSVKSNARTRSDTKLVGFGAYPRQGGVQMMEFAESEDSSPPIVHPKSSLSNPHVRKLMPEVLIWSLNSGSGSLAQQLTAPDTITTWVLSAFAVGSQRGFGALNEPAELTVFQPFFVKLDVPYAVVVRNEMFEIKAVVFNYQTTAQSVRVVLDKSDDFEVSTDGKDYSSKQLSANVEVPANDGASVSIWIRPLILGEIKMKLSGSSSSSSDAVEKVVTVEPEGEIRYGNKPVFIRFKERTTQSYPIKVADMLGKVTSDMVVTGSKMFQFQCIGDILGPSLSSLGSQVRMPTGCGEQTMVIFAPNVYIYKYLKSVNILTDELKSKTERFAESGYQRELTYRRSDGGFSAFGERDAASSTWLTAFVMRSFQAAVDYVGTQIDKDIFTTSWKYLKNSAKRDGTFTEPGKVLHHSMKGGATSNDNLAAYIYTAYAEAGGKAEYRWGSLKATKDLLKRLATSASDPYQLAIVAYATSMLDEDKATSLQVMNRLKTLATVDGDLMYWKPAEDQSDVPEYSRSGPSIIETSAYALLTLCNHNEIEDATMVARWLMSQRNSLGGFSSTQDTVVGLQALAEFASKLGTGNDIKIDATFNYDSGSPITKTFTISESNAKILQSFDLPRDRQDLSTVDVTASGQGVALAQLSMKYNVQTPKVMDSGDYRIILLNEVNARKKRSTDNSGNGTTNSFTIKTCVKPITKPAGNGMVVYEMGIPTGFSGDLEGSINSNGLNLDPMPVTPLKRIESGDRKLVYYFDALEEEICVSGHLTRTSLAMNVQPPVAKIFNYYDPDLVNSTFFSFPGMSYDDVATPNAVKWVIGNENGNAGCSVQSSLFWGFLSTLGALGASLVVF